MKASKRNAILRVNRFQQRLFFPVIFAFVIGCCVAWLSIMYALIGNYLFDPVLYSFQGLIPALLAFATALMIILIFWTLYISGRYLSVHERIIHELDKVLDGKENGPLKVRNGDEMFEELVKRVNALIEKVR
ncbi:MAG: hypothetical protein JW847_06740 [Candidatus Omnitrophica bacterium]|nr:hypothetical protein [Candidatus Omnitrophota bacterium]